jgi:hypothetical protein
MDELEKVAYEFMNNKKDPLQVKKELMEQYQKRKPDKVRTAEEMGIVFEKSRFDYFRGEYNSDEITITLSYDEWYEIWGEASGHLSYWGAESESVDKLGNILEGFRENKE